VKFEALVELSREAEGIIPSSLLRNVSKACFGGRTRDLLLKNSSLKIENRQITFPYLRKTVNVASGFLIEYC
jgi:hypothetical protein